MVFVQETVVNYSREFLLKLRRVNYVTPKNYLDFINTYNKLLEEKDKFVLEQVNASSKFRSGKRSVPENVPSRKTFRPGKRSVPANVPSHINSS